MIKKSCLLQLHMIDNTVMVFRDNCFSSHEKYPSNVQHTTVYTYLHVRKLNRKGYIIKFTIYHPTPGPGYNFQLH